MIANKEDLYRALINRHGYTPNEIANMTPYQQFLILGETGDEEYITFSNLQEHQEWLIQQQSS